MISSRLPKNDRAKDVKKRLARSRRAALRKKIKIISRSHQDLAVQNAILRSYNQCLLWIWIAIDSRNRRTNKKELIRSVNLKHVSFPPFLPHLFPNTATYHQTREYLRSNSITDPIIHHPRLPCSDTHTVRIAGIEMDTRSESTSIARLVCYDCNTDGVRSVCL